MKNWFVLCAILALFVGVLRHILTAAGGKQIANSLHSILNVVLFSLALGAFANDLPQLTSVSPVYSENDLQELQNETLAEVFALAETELASQLCTELEREFGHTPTACTVSVNRETLVLDSIEVFYPTSCIISTYAVKNYIYTTYRVAAEVIVK